MYGFYIEAASDLVTHVNICDNEFSNGKNQVMYLIK